MATGRKTILEKMLDRLFAGLASGPNLNCRPHSSRQRLDWTQLARLQDLDPAQALIQLLSDKQAVQLKALVEPPAKTDAPPESKKRSKSKSTAQPAVDAAGAGPDPAVSEAELKHRSDWSAQQSLLTKLRGLAEDAREYEQDTGVHVLHVGFPLLSLPPGKSGLGGTKRLLAPIAFVSVSLELQAGTRPSVRIEGLHDGADFLVPNEALFAWLERQTGKRILPESALNNSPAEIRNSAASITGDEAAADEPAEASPDEQPAADRNSSTGNAPVDPWHELNDLIRRVVEALNLPPVQLAPCELNELRTAPRADDEDSRAEIVRAAVIGLFPMNNQGLLRDMQEMVTTPPQSGPVQSFLTLDVQLDSPVDQMASAERHAVERSSGPSRNHRLVSHADPCQARAVWLARECRGLVVHGPPGTGKSQTITNMIGDHLVLGERVLLVCDKRTALDVVYRRLDHLGLGSLCALIHDPQHDQRNLYKQVKEQLEALPAAKTYDRAQSRFDSIERKLQAAYQGFAAGWMSVMDRDPQRGVSFHERMGEWLEATAVLWNTRRVGSSTQSDDAEATAESSNGSTSRKRRRRRGKVAAEVIAGEPVSVLQFQTHETEIREVFAKAFQVGYANQPWTRCVGIELADFLARPRSQIREAMSAIIDCSRSVDGFCENRMHSFVVPEPIGAGDSADQQSISSFSQQGETRRQLAAQLQQCVKDVAVALRRRWANASAASVDRAWERMNSLNADVEAQRNVTLDPQLLLLVQHKTPSFDEIVISREDLKAYAANRGTWWTWIAFGKRKSAGLVLRSYGLTLNDGNVDRLIGFLSAVKLRQLIAALLKDLSGSKSDVAHGLNDEDLFAEWDRLKVLLELLRCVLSNPLQIPIQENIRKTLVEGNDDDIAALVTSANLADALDELDYELKESKLFDAAWMQGALEKVCQGQSITDELRQLESSADGLTDILRIRNSLNAFPSALRELVERAIRNSPTAEDACHFVRCQVLSDDISGWLKSNPQLQTFDGSRLDGLIREIRNHQNDKQEAVRDLILNLWTSRQRERLLASTGTRLNGRGADLRRRLTVRGERAMRLRQVITAGSKIDGGDPLFDMRPVWMASPETVAQIFPREELFDLVIFDEASQCRLEEALPVLTRAKRVVIAGDPKQLPPSRFFESALVTSEMETVETESDLFEAHQSNIEDLLTAAMSLEIQECYLDVHYRSRNADLVEFSNEHFYGSRLQAIPGHPRNRVRFAPISLHHVGGIYEERCNEKEALEVCHIVAGLLRRAEPPSIGIACFNLTQRDLILEKLAERCVEDNEFAQQLSAARSRIGSGAFEGLFVKNLENVQGDERDHMIISTTYGPDKQGRFYKRFGPLGQAGGGRRLNVLITRAREEVHLVTSIPKELYRNLPSIPEGQQPGGGWLLFAYLAYAEQLAECYERVHDIESKDSVFPATVVERKSGAPSQFAGELARLMVQQHELGSDIHWGNDGFCVDVAVHHPTRCDDRTLGVLCDGTRFPFAEDPLEWDLFRTTVLESQGWELIRCWTPEFFRDPEGSLKKFMSEAIRIANSEPNPEAIRVDPE